MCRPLNTKSTSPEAGSTPTNGDHTEKPCKMAYLNQGFQKENRNKRGGDALQRGGNAVGKERGEEREQRGRTMIATILSGFPINLVVQAYDNLALNKKPWKSGKHSNVFVPAPLTLSFCCTHPPKPFLSTTQKTNTPKTQRLRMRLGVGRFRT